MKLKQVLFLAAIFVILLAAVFIRQLRRPAELFLQEFASIDLGFDSEKVEKLQIGKGDEKSMTLFTLVKNSSGAWSIPDLQNARADQEKIERLLKEIKDAKGELRAEDKSLWPDFGLAEEQAFRVLLFDKDWNNLLTLYVGTKQAGGSLFIRKTGSDKVYLTDANLLGNMGIYGDPETEKPDMNHWAALDLVSVETDKVKKIEARRFKDGREVLTASVVRETDPENPEKKKWRYTRAEVPFALDAEKILQFLASFDSWRASKVLDAKAKDYGFANPTWQMKLGLEEGELVITAGAKDAENQGIYAQVMGQNVVFLLPDYSFQNFNIDDSKFFADNPLAVEPDKTEKLTIKADDKRFVFEPKTKKTDSLTGYLNDLKSFSVDKLLFDPADQKKIKAGRFVIEIQKEGAVKTLDVGDLVSEEPKQYAATQRGVALPFAISEYNFKRLFDNLDRLKDALPGSAPAPAPAAPADAKKA